ncbi:tetratricopeptide repeat protein [Winogradskyella sp. R77965]|uniref:tetratricopeptide repeat-containing sensor histidine kinase n=1 Tax=Winogradskyella sp. R77965 TaxID=3093872 RepID=UPI0037DD6D25
MPPTNNKVSNYIRVFNIYIKRREQIELSEKYADSIYILSNSLNYEFGIASSHYSHARVNLFKGNFKEAKNHINEYINYHEKNNDSLRLSNGLFLLGKSLKMMGKFDESLIHLYRTATISEKIGDNYGLADSYNTIANINKSLKKYNEALEYYNKAILIFESLNNVKMKAMLLQNIGNVYGGQGNYKEAIKNYKEALGQIENLDGDLSFNKSIILGNLGGSYNATGNYESGLEYHLKANVLRRRLNNKRSLAHGLAGEATSYINLKKFKDADKSLNEGIDLATQIESINLLWQLFELKALMGKKKGDFKMAFENIELSHKWKDSIFNLKSNEQILELETKYQTAQKDKEITLLTKEKEIQEKETQRQDDIKKAILIGLFLTILLAGLVFYTLRQKLKNQKIIAAKNEEIKVSNLKKELGTLEMKALRAQMNPHFLFNCMNSINTMILRDDNAKASKYLTKFSKLVRLILENSENPKITLQDELEMLNAYIALESIRFKGKIDYTLDVSEDIDKETTLIPSMILQPFVENAIWHGLLHTKNKTGKLSIKVYEENDILHCSILDNGVGRASALKIHKKTKLKKKSMGIKITTERLTLLAKEKINEVVKIIDLKDDKDNPLGTQVDILIPIS